jgi:hypothetical protein
MVGALIEKEELMHPHLLGSEEGQGKPSLVSNNSSL